MKLSEEMLNAEMTMTMREFQEQVLDGAAGVLTAVVGQMATTLREKPDSPATTHEFAQLLDDIVKDWSEMDLSEFLQ